LPVPQFLHIYKQGLEYLTSKMFKMKTALLGNVGLLSWGWAGGAEKEVHRDPGLADWANH
jgi:hypothetical protein